MASVIGMDDTALAAVCREADVDIANLNCPGQIVISGDKDKIATTLKTSPVVSGVDCAFSHGAVRRSHRCTRGA